MQETRFAQEHYKTLQNSAKLCHQRELMTMETDIKKNGATEANSLLSPSSYQSLEALANAAGSEPASLQRGLDNWHYTSQACFELERKAMLEDGWAAIGFVDDVPEPGCVHPVSLWGLPLVMVHDQHHRIRVFHNVCRHRGHILVEAREKKQGLLVCPYHNWSYALDGRLVRAPYAEDFPCESVTLAEVSSTCFGRLVLVCLSESAPKLKESIPDFYERYGMFDQLEWHADTETSFFELHAHANWKLAAENHAESYHLPFIHPDLNARSPMERHEHLRTRNNPSFCGQISAQFELSGAARAGFGATEALGAHWHARGEYPVLFPNVLWGFHNDQVVVTLLVPLSPSETLERVAVWYLDKPSAHDAPLSAARRHNAELWRGVFNEDISALEAMQRGRHSWGFDGGRFVANHDGPSFDFHCWAATRYHARMSPAQS